MFRGSWILFCRRHKSGITLGTLLIALLVVSVLLLGAETLSAAKGTVTIKELIYGAPIHGANGLAFDSHNRLYVASALGQEIVVMDPLSGRVLDRIGSERGVVGPDDLTFGPDGSLYWTDILSGEVGRLAPDGTVTKQLVAPFVNPITMSDDGRLFVAQAFIGDGLFEIDPQLVDPPTLIMGTGNPLYHLNAMDFGPDGWLYAPRQQLGQTVRINVNAVPPEVEIFSSEIEGAVKFDAFGRLHVLDEMHGVMRYDSLTGEWTSIADSPSIGTDNMAFDEGGKIYISNFRDGSIHQALPSGGNRLVSPGGLIVPNGIAVVADDHAGESIFVSDFWTVRQFDGLTGKSGLVGSDFFFDSPMSANADGQNLILTSWFGNTVEVWDPHANGILELHENFAAPMSAVRFQGDLLVAELATGSVLRQGTDPLDRQVLLTGFAVPAGLAATESEAWLTDWALGNVWQIADAGSILSAPILVASGLAQPEGIAVEHDGNLLVVESSAGRLSRINLETASVTIVADDLDLGKTAAAGWPPTWYLNDVAVGERGDIYVTGDIANVVYRIRERP